MLNMSLILTKYPKALGPTHDGQTHVNIYSMGKTAAGRMASNFHEAHHGYDTVFGKFATLEGLYHVLRIVDYYMSVGRIDSYVTWDHLKTLVPKIDRLRLSNGASCIRIGRELKASVYGNTKYKPAEFSKFALGVYVDALVRKLHMPIDASGVSLGSTLARYVYDGICLSHYYVVGENIKFPPHHEWLPELLTKIVELIDPNDSTFDLEVVLGKAKELLCLTQ